MRLAHSLSTTTEEVVMTVREHSRTAYMSAVVEGITGRVRKRIMEVMLNSPVPMTRRMIEKQSGIRISTVTPAVLSLLEAGYIIKAFDGVDPSSGYRAEFLHPVWPTPTQREFDLGAFVEVKGE